MRVLAFLLALLPALAFGQGVQYEPRVGGGTGNTFAPYPGRVSPIVSLIAWDKGGSQDWGAGIPSPTIDCAAVGTSASASLQCSGATPSFAGPVQTAAGSPWWYRWDSAVRPAIALNGSTDYWDLGDAFEVPTAFTVCGEGLNLSDSGVQAFVSKYASPDYSFYFGKNAGAVTLRVCKAGPSCTNSGQVTMGTGAFVACASYNGAGGDGAAVLLLNANGTAATNVTNGVAPLLDGSTQVRIGRSDSSYATGSIRRAAIWTGWAADAAQLAQMVATQWGLAHDKPAGTVATHARTDSTLSCPFRDDECFWVGPGAPAIHAPTYAGWASGGAVAGGIEVYGVGQNALAYSETLVTGTTIASPWIANGTASLDDNAAVAPDGTTTADLVNFAAIAGVGEISAIYQPFTGTAAPWRFTVWARTVSGTGTLYLTLSDVATAPETTTAACSVTTTWQRCSVSRTLAAATRYVMIGALGPVIYGQPSTQPALSVYLWGAQVTPTAYPVPYRATTGTAYAGSASTATTLTVPVALTDPARWAIAWTGSAADWTPAGVEQILWRIGNPEAANSSYQNTAGIARQLFAYDAVGAYKRYSFSQALTPGTQHTLVSGVSSGTGSLSLDGAAQTVATAGAGVPQTAVGATLNIGTGTGAYYTQFNGLVSRVAQCKRASGCR